MSEVPTKSKPVAVRVNAAPPAVAVEGEIEVSEGRGLLMVKVWAFDVPPSGVGLNTVMGNEPVTVMSLAGMLAVNWVELTKVVGRLKPLKRTTDVETKFVPLMVIVKGAPP
jgi:hypothetical protein